LKEKCGIFIQPKIGIYGQVIFPQISITYPPQKAGAGPDWTCQTRDPSTNIKTRRRAHFCGWRVENVLRPTQCSLLTSSHLLYHLFI